MRLKGPQRPTLKLKNKENKGKVQSETSVFSQQDNHNLKHALLRRSYIIDHRLAYSETIGQVKIQSNSDHDLISISFVPCI